MMHLENFIFILQLWNLYKNTHRYVMEEFSRSNKLEVDAKANEQKLNKHVLNIHVNWWGNWCIKNDFTCMLQSLELKCLKCVEFQNLNWCILVNLLEWTKKKTYDREFSVSIT